MAQPRERPLNELLSRDMVDIYVGQENTHWILHEKLLCHRSKFFRNIFYSKDSHNHTFGLPDEDDEPFRLFVGWLYSSAVPTPREEKDLGHLFDLYLMGEKWEIRGLVQDVLEAVRNFYHDNDSYPALRRVQYVYANTEQESPMRQLLIQSMARFFVLGDGMPPVWDKALRKNGQLAVDIIIAVQKWKLEKDSIPDPREASVVPIMEESDRKVDAKKDNDDEEQPQENGDAKPEESEEEKAQVNGVSEHEDEEQEEGEQEGEAAEEDEEQ
ncbi:hypothetical protein MBLNU459_g1711t1 [Dothideomycetes sp. NU459]